jgi:hypothetical protein
LIERACVPWEKRRRLNLKLWSVGDEHGGILADADWPITVIPLTCQLRAGHAGALKLTVAVKQGSLARCYIYT